MTTSAARSNSISQRVMKPLEVDVFTAARDLRDNMEGSRLSLADRERGCFGCATQRTRWAAVPSVKGIHRTRR